MARAEQKAATVELHRQSDFSSVLFQSICPRCGGLLVNEVSLDLMNSTGELQCPTRRCVQCGDILDPVILRNRCIRQGTMPVQRSGNPLPSHYSMERR